MFKRLLSTKKFAFTAITTTAGVLAYNTDPRVERRVVALVRSTRTAICAVRIIRDYTWHLKVKQKLFGEVSQDQYLLDKADCHQRSANTLLQLFKTNG